MRQPHRVRASRSRCDGSNRCNRANRVGEGVHVLGAVSVGLGAFLTTLPLHYGDFVRQPSLYHPHLAPRVLFELLLPPDLSPLRQLLSRPLREGSLRRISPPLRVDIPRAPLRPYREPYSDHTESAKAIIPRASLRSRYDRSTPLGMGINAGYADCSETAISRRRIDSAGVTNTRRQKRLSPLAAAPQGAAARGESRLIGIKKRDYSKSRCILSSIRVILPERVTVEREFFCAE